MMNLEQRKTRSAGLCIIVSMLAGIFSVAPAVDSAKFLTEAAANSNQVIGASISQFIISLAYIGFAILLYPILKKFGNSLVIGFLSFRIMAATLMILGILLLLAVLVLSQESLRHLSENTSALEVLGNLLKTTRDYVNHVFMVLTLCLGNFMFYILLIRSKLIPPWLSVWGIIGAFLSIVASILVLFQAVEIITAEYLVLNAPTALQELILGFWLMIKGFDDKVMSYPTGLLESERF
ncbi:DUF4386 domain-containing protein [Rapidithrix thailandica]|uniref:DUF4386 domain-containing protein n=1 Tax=Rapidithrix thailandica TaxID=413964 RepID=A0AAW9S5K9_9BACT